MIKFAAKIAIFLFTSTAVLASPKTPSPTFTKGEICGGLFFTLAKEKQFDVSGSDEATHSAFLSFKNFRVNILRDYHNNQLGFENINTDSLQAKRPQFSVVADRIRGLEKVYQWNYTPIKGEELYIAFGGQARGVEAIEDFFNSLTEESLPLKNVRSIYISRIAQYNIHNTVPLALSASAFVLGYFTDVTSYTTSAVGLLTTAGLFFYQKSGNALHPVVKYRLNMAENFGREFKKFTNKVLSAAYSNEPRAWVYWGDSGQVFALLPHAFNQEKLAAEQMTKEDLFYINSQIEIPQSYVHKKFLEGTASTSDVQLDFLLSYERKGAQSYEPVLSYFYRLGAPISRPVGK